MAFATMHMAVGMACASALGVGACLVLKRGWRWQPMVMTAGAIWAVLPELPALVRESASHVPVLSSLGSPSVEAVLHRGGDLFFFHRSLDAQPGAYAMMGLFLMLLLYNAAVIGVMLYDRHRNKPAPWDGRERRHHAGVVESAEAALLPAKVAMKPARFNRAMQVRSSHLTRTA